MLGNRKFFLTFFNCSASEHCFIFLVSVIGVKIFNILESLLVTCLGVSWTPCRRVVDTAGVVVVGPLHLVVILLLSVCSVAFHRSVGSLSFMVTSCLLSGLFQASLEAILGCCLFSGFRQPVPFFHCSHWEWKLPLVRSGKFGHKALCSCCLSRSHSSWPVRKCEQAYWNFLEKSIG